VVLGNVIAVEPRGVVGLDDAQPLRVLRLQRRSTAIDMIEDAELDDGRRYFTTTGSVPLTTGAVVYASSVPVVAKQM